MPRANSTSLPSSDRARGFADGINKGLRIVKPLLLLACVTLGLSATANAGDIHVGTPLISGDVSHFANRQEVSRTALSSKQLQGLADWLEHHQSGWDGMLTEATSEPVELRVNLTHSDATVTSICVIARVAGGHYLRLTGPGKWAYESFLGLWKSWAATRSLSAQDLAALEGLVSAT